MTTKEALLKIRAMLNESPKSEEADNQQVVEEAKVDFKEYSLADGTKLNISALEVGGDVQLADGTPAPAGEYAMADGTSVQVDETGKIVEIASAKEDTMPEEETPAPTTEQEMAAPVVEEKANEEFAAKVAEIEAKFAEEKAALEAKFSALEAKVKDGFNQFADLVEEIAKAPVAEPTQKGSNSFSAYISSNDVKLSKLEKYRKALLK